MSRSDTRGRPSRAWRDVLLRTTVECWRIEDGHHAEKKLQAQSVDGALPPENLAFARKRARYQGFGSSIAPLG